MFTFSVIIPVKTKRDLCPELLPSLRTQSLAPLEILIITDQICPGGPATKRDYGASMAQGSVLAFLDADAYPTKDWLKTASSLLTSPQLAAVCGPGLTPPQDPPLAQLSGFYWSSLLGAGPFLYRSRSLASRLVDDYPSFNLFVKQKYFQKVGGFATSAWPGEDTKLCLELTHTLNKQILYHPKILVYHHRRELIIPHLRQLSRYGTQRGHFVKLYPATSLRPSYFLPLILLLFFPLTIPLGFASIILLWFPLKLPLFRHLPPALFNFLFYLPTLLLSHLTYSFFFLKGLISQEPSLST